MRFSRLKYYIVMLALLAVTNQSFAVVNIPCAGMDNHAASAKMEGDMDMALADHAQPGDSDAHGIAECCNQKQCSLADCLTATAAVIGAPSPFSFPYSLTCNSEYSLSYPVAETRSLFRPPISR